MFEDRYTTRQPDRAAQLKHPVTKEIAPEALIRITKKGQRLLAAYEARRFKRAA